MLSRSQRRTYKWRPNTEGQLRQMINNPAAIHNFPVTVNDPRYMEQVRRQGVIGQTGIQDLIGPLPAVQLEFSNETIGKLAVTTLILMFINSKM